jgi:copper chaperone
VFTLAVFWGYSLILIRLAVHCIQAIHPVCRPAHTSIFCRRCIDHMFCTSTCCAGNALPGRDVHSDLQQSARGASKGVFSVTGMSCGACVGSITGVVSPLPGVVSVSVALLAEKMEVLFEPSRIAADVIAAAVSQAGYGCVVTGVRHDGDDAASTEEQSPESIAHEMKARQRQESRNWAVLLCVAAVFSIPIAILHMIVPRFPVLHEKLMEPEGVTGLSIPMKVGLVRRMLDSIQSCSSSVSITIPSSPPPLSRTCTLGAH